MAADNTLELLIKMGASGREDVQAANDLLAETGKVTTETTKATEDLGNAEHEAAGHAEHLHLNHRALHQIMHLIGKETAPELGHALAGALYGPIGIALAVGYAFEGIREHIAKTNEELDKMSEKAAEAFANVKTNLFDAIRDEEFSTEKVDKFFKKIEEDSTKAKTAIENTLQLLHEQESAQTKINKAAEANELERVKTDPNKTPTQREAAAVEIKNRYARMNAALEEQGQQDDVNAARAEFAQKNKELNELIFKQHQSGASGDQVADIDRAMKGLPENDQLRRQFEKDKAAGNVDYSKIATGSNQKSIQDELDAVRGKLGIDEKTNRPTEGGDADRLEKLKTKYEGKFSELEQSISEMENLAANSKRPGEAENYEASAQTFRNRLAALKKSSGVDEAEAAVTADKARIEQLQNAGAALAQFVQSQKDLSEAIDRLKREVDAAQTKLDQTTKIAGIKNNATATVTDTNADTGNLGLLDKFIGKKGTDAGLEGILTKGESALNAYAAGKNLNDAQKDDLAKLTQLLAALGNNRTQINSILNALLTHVLGHDQELANLQLQLAAMAQRQANSRNKTSG